MKNILQKFTINPSVKVKAKGEDGLAEDVWELCDIINFIPQKIVHVGAAGCHTEPTFLNAIKNSYVILFEPKIEFYNELIEAFSDKKNVSIFNIGIYNKIGKFKFYNKWATTCLEECIKIPDLLSEKDSFDENDTFFANCALFSGFDDGRIDFLAIDTNGAEWYCLEKVISRPAIICIETHYTYRNYRNPFINQIYRWMYDNHYVKYAINESVTVFLRIK